VGWDLKCAEAAPGGIGPPPVFCGCCVLCVGKKETNMRERERGERERGREREREIVWVRATPLHVPDMYHLCSTHAYKRTREDTK